MSALGRVSPWIAPKVSLHDYSSFLTQCGSVQVYNFLMVVIHFICPNWKSTVIWAHQSASWHEIDSDWIHNSSSEKIISNCESIVDGSLNQKKNSKTALRIISFKYSPTRSLLSYSTINCRIRCNKYSRLEISMFCFACVTLRIMQYHCVSLQSSFNIVQLVELRVWRDRMRLTGRLSESVIKSVGQVLCFSCSSVNIQNTQGHDCIWACALLYWSQLDWDEFCAPMTCHWQWRDCDSEFIDQMNNSWKMESRFISWSIINRA